MDKQRALHIARAAVIVCGLLLLLMLALDWWHATAQFTGFVAEGGRSGRAGIGIVAVACTVALLLSEFVQIEILKAARVVLAVGALAAVVAAALTGSASAVYADEVVAESDALGWPAYAAIVLALGVVAATLVERFIHKPARLALPPLARIRPPASRATEEPPDPG